MKARLGGLVGALLAALISAYFIARAPHIGVSVYVPGYTMHGRLEHLLATGDGQAIVSMARGTFHPVYRWTRPFPVALTWLVGLGHSSWFPYAMLVICIVGCGVLAYAVSEWVGSPLGALVVLFPGVLYCIEWCSPEMLGLGLAILGWRHRSTLPLVFAGLTRETLLLFSRRWRPLLICAGWVLIAFLLFRGNGSKDAIWGPGYQPSPIGFFSIFTTPLREGAALHFTAVGLTIGLGFLALYGRVGPAKWYLLWMPFMGPGLTGYWHDITRYLLPLWVLGFVALVKISTQGDSGTMNQSPNGMIGAASGAETN